MADLDVALRLPERLVATVSFGVAELTGALRSRGYRLVDRGAGAEIVLARADGPLPAALGPTRPRSQPESYTISRSSPTTLCLIGRDDKGLMYACLDLAEQLYMGADLGSAAERDCAPELAVRGVYTFLHNAEAERGWLYDPNYWQSYADELARWRYNRFNLIYGHQSPYLIPIYTYLLDDLDLEFPDIRATDVTSEGRERNLRALQTASAAMANRGINFFLGIWNSRPWTIANGVWENQPTQVVGTDDLAQLVPYTRRGFERLMELCPAIGGIQLRMNIESGVADQRFFVQAYVPALKSLASKGRRLVVELRNWGLHPDTIEAFHNAGTDIIVSTKYFAEYQVMPYQPPSWRGSYSYDSFLRRDKLFPLQWHLWNLGSHRLFVWGDPNFARRFVKSCHLGQGIGFEVTPPGSQKGFSQWGQVSPSDWQIRRDLPERWGFQRYWFFHMAFGRMGYDPSTGDEVFRHQLARRTTQGVAPTLLAAYKAASQVISYLISQRMDDPNMYVWPELDCGGPIDHNTIAPPGEVTLFATAREHATERLADRGSAKRSPFDAARDLAGYTDDIEARLVQLAEAPGLADNQEYRTVQKDFAALAALARYHATKAGASGNLALFYASGERSFLDAAEAEAEEGVRLWDELCARTEDYYHKLHLGPSGGHWRDNRPRVRYDLQRIRRVRELFDAHGLFFRGFDFGQPLPQRQPIRWVSGLEPEPRFIGVDAATEYSPERRYGWLRTAGLRAEGFYQLPRDLVWGVHYVRPGVDYDPAAVEAIPLDSLTQRYLTADEPRSFRVDLADGEYEVTLLAPAVAGLITPIRIVGEIAELGETTSAVARMNVEVKDGALEVLIGGKGPWALAGLIIRRRAPEVAHLPLLGLQSEEDFSVTATATAPDGVKSVVLRYKVGGDWREIPMAGDGVAFHVVVPAVHLVGEALEYEIVAEDKEGRMTRRGGFRAPIVRQFRLPRVVGHVGRNTWNQAEALEFRLTLEDGAFAKEVRLHYREADQNRDFRVATLAGGRSGEYVFRVDPKQLDENYELIYYFEVIDVLGGGSFYSDPFREARYFICRPA